MSKTRGTDYLKKLAPLRFCRKKKEEERKGKSGKIRQ
jgi:hypothetical protein